LPEFERLSNPIRIGVAGDTHRSSRNPRALPVGLRDAFLTCDIIFHTGDVNAPWVIRDLERIAPVRAVRGNNDEMPLSRDLPVELFFESGGIRIGLMHGHLPKGTARQNTIVRMTGVVDLAIYGHSHVPEVVEHEGLMLVNPGSPTQKRYQPDATFAIVSITDTVVADIHTV
jgi:uncharacterized protein